ncbi:hypothetical protein R50072_26060 [Simiduia litorea]|uniref:putative bifunctional diguanylate cyclase/phosphodiesterase n=1 Tax=Simiduia litorea TaxID=1435348 RepID=UPI0036F1FDC0
MARPRLFSLATKAQLLLGTFLVLSLSALLYFHWKEQNKLRETELTQDKLALASQLNATLNEQQSEQAKLLQQWALHLPSNQSRDLSSSLENDKALLKIAGNFRNILVFDRTGLANLNPDLDWPEVINSDWVNTVYRSDTTQSRLACTERCSQFIGIPLHVPHQATKIIVAELDLIALAEAFFSETRYYAYLIKSDKAGNWLSIWPIVSHGDQPKLETPAQLTNLLNETKDSWGQLRYHQKNLPIYNNRDLSWLIYTDEEPELLQRAELLKLQSIIALCTLVALLCFSWLVSRFHLRRLFKQVNILRLVSEQQFEEARLRLPKKPKKSLDELDLLAEVAAELTYQLEANARTADSKNREMERLALYDPLTNLPNRNLFVYEIEQLLESGVDINKSAILVIDVDKFQRINDSLGHQSGDHLLSKIADRIRAAIGSKDFCARLSGNVFGVLIVSLNAADLKIRLNKISEMIRQPLILKQQKLIITVSIGVAKLEHGVPTVEQLRNAEIAMYRAKQQGGNSHLEFTPEFKSISRSKVSLEAEIHRALEQKEFRLYLQSKVDMSSTIRGFEALCRWDHPDRGILMPAEFVPVMADLGLQTPLDKWMLEASCRQLKTWHTLYPDIGISVNVASDHFSSPSFLPFLQQTINRYGIKPGQLELEITETLLMDNITLALQTIEKVKALGVSVAIDDFGTGYSSLSYLKNLPVDTLKIDREFIKDIPFDESDMHISAVIIFLARQLGFKVVAEGVETSEQLVFLKANHCDLAQGYLFSKPIPAHKAMIVLESQRSESHGKSTSIYS